MKEEPTSSPDGGHGGQPPPQGAEPETYIVPEIDPAVAALNDEQLLLFRDKIRMIIDRRIDGIDYAERRRQQMVTQLGAVVALGLALLPLLSGASAPVRHAYTAASLALVVGGLITWALYARQTNPPYAFLGPAQTRTWFYRQALPDVEALQRAAAGAKEDFRKVHDEQFKRFAGVQTAVISEPRRDASDDLRHLFLLHQNEMTKNRQLSLLSRALTLTIGAALLVALIAGVTSVLVASDPSIDRQSTATVNGAKVSVEWRTTGAHRTTEGSVESELVVRATVRNRSGHDVTVEALMASDAEDRAIPLDAPIQRVPVAAGESVTIGPLIAWAPRSLVDDIHTIRPQ